MDFKELVKSRYSVRAYKSNAVEKEKLDLVLEAARLAPTAANRQPFRIIVINTADRREQLSRIYKAESFIQAPLVICVCCVRDKGWVRFDGKNYSEMDAAIVMDHITLQATDIGLGTCWIGAFDREAAREVLQLPEGIEPLVFTPLGYAADSSTEKRRKPLEELVEFRG